MNPARLPARARDSVCEQCHLAGEARIPNPGRRFEDFRPGMALEEVFAVYVGGRDFRVAGHAEQLALSACARASGDKLWCGACHDPHGKTARKACLGCHEGSHRRDADCASCHLPQREPAGVPHTAYTDHRIGGGATPPARLRAWREPPGALAQRGLGLAYVSVGERDQSAEALQEGFRLLLGVQQEFARDPAVLTALGLVLMRKAEPAEAARLFEQAVRLEPQRAVYHLNLANAWQQAGEPDRAAGARKQAFALDPLLERWAVR
jgi:tetratricopeptide (TPR) repeat protein